MGNTLKNIKKKKYYILLVLILLLWTIVAFYIKFHNKTFRPNMLYYTCNTEEPGVILSGDKGLYSYGPYDFLKPGIYKLVINYETEKKAYFDIVYQVNGKPQTFSKVKLPKDRNKICKDITITKLMDVQSLEIRTYYSGKGSFKIENIKIQKVRSNKWKVMFAMLIAFLCYFYINKRHLIVSNRVHIDYKRLGLLVMNLFFLGGSILWVFAYRKPTYYLIYLLFTTIVSVVCKKYDYKIEAWLGIYTKTVLCFAYIMGCFWLFDILIYNVTIHKNGIADSILVPYVFTFFYSFSIAIIVVAVRRIRLRQIIFIVLFTVYAVLFFVQSIYYKVFYKFCGLSDVGFAGEGADYTGYITSLINKNEIILLVLFFIMGVVGVRILALKAHYCSPKIYFLLIPVFLTGVVYSSYAYKLDEKAWNAYASDSYIYKTMADRTRFMDLFGLLHYEGKDLYLTMKNVIVKNSANKKMIDHYFKKNKSVENKYSGIFKDKNVIFILMESIDDIAMNEEIMPTLYKMSQDGMNFTNMYASIYGSAATINAETVTNIGLYVPTDGNLIQSYSKNDFPYSLAALYTKNGFSAKQFHYNDATFYKRDQLNKTFGYEEYISYKNYLEGDPVELIDDSYLVSNTGLFDKFIGEDKFFNYVISYSAHLAYDEPMSENNLKKWTDSNEMNVYLEKATHTDKMLNSLIEKLEERNKLKDTIIVAVGDHYPYGLLSYENEVTENTLYELSGVDRYEELLYKVPFVIYGEGIPKMEIDKICSSIDIVPTIANMSGFADASVYLGNDIMDKNYEGYAYFQNGAWVYKDSFYKDGKLIYGNLGESEIEKMNKLAAEKIQVNNEIYKANYYKRKSIRKKQK